MKGWLVLVGAAVLSCADAFCFSSVPSFQLRLRTGAQAACQNVRMAGFGVPSSAKDSKSPAKITGIPRKTLKNYGEVVKGGATSHRVFARVQGEDKWYEVGEVASTPDDPNAACTLHKRLALEYAVDQYPSLKTKAKLLELGYSASGQGEDDIVLVTKAENAAIAKDAHGFRVKGRIAKVGQGEANPVSGAVREGSRDRTSKVSSTCGRKAKNNPLCGLSGVSRGSEAGEERVKAAVGGGVV